MGDEIGFFWPDGTANEWGIYLGPFLYYLPCLFFLIVLSKGQMETKQHRFLASRGGYAWIVTQATIVYDKQKPQSVVCVNYLIR